MAGMKRERNISDWGAFAEKFVYEQMISTFKNVDWVSENAKKAGVNSKGIGGMGYDLKYTNDDGETIYVEIKSTSGTGIAFVITENELNFAEAHPRHYEVILVTNVMDDDEREIYRLENLFSYADGEGRFNNSRFNITVDNYTVRCQIEVSASEEEVVCH
jgi:DNA-binding sugar fermentation-stimulating protein